MNRFDELIVRHLKTSRGSGLEASVEITRAFQRTGWIVAIAQNSDDVGGFAFEPEPLTGAKP